MRVLLALITVAVTIYSVVDCLRCTDAEVRTLPRPIWLIITLIPLVGGLLWLTFGRPAAGPPVTRPARVIAPDDDPDFLQSLDRTFRERRRQAAEETRRRQEEQRRAQARHTEDEERRRGLAGGRSGSGKPGNGKPGSEPSDDGSSGGDDRR
ncbi:MAG TPA: PLD nuclease N-terminal domain-containing protein [Kineosporiaceae bacterium]|nr:PLD nuclease N-terminal domain-containing protein [Kineosporiaceae bacterium]